MEYQISSKEQVAKLWSKTYNQKGKPDWSHILPYYDKDICFRDSIQKINGIDNFTAMTERLTKRSQELEMKIIRVAQEDKFYFLEWEMALVFKNKPKSVIYGASRVTINEQGKISQQRDYYDLWGDIFDNIPFMAKPYRKFMKKKFG